METKTENLCNLARQLKLAGAGGAMNDLLINAQQQQISYLDFAFGLFNAEIDHRNQQNLAKRLRNAKLPANHDLDLWQENHLGWNIPKTSNSTARMHLARTKLQHYPYGSQRNRKNIYRCRALLPSFTKGL